ncbi:MAG: Glutathione S-transferase domain protein [Rhodospirillales bacterium]|jgi:glutathione S-transferase|nr:Glutathione S-transferase domain protein [Rhodospirillales bacterium]
MRLIGMLDSPYVRRTAISMRFMGLPFAQESVSVFRHYDRFAEINPVVKAPTLVLDDGTVLMESGLILDYLERLVAPERRLTPERPGDHARAQRLVGLALAACEKTMQIVYETQLRPADKQHRPWLDRIDGQLRTAYRLLEAEIGAGGPWLVGGRPLQADVTVAVGWRFTQLVLAGRIAPTDYPALARFSARAEALAEFAATPPD